MEASLEIDSDATMDLTLDKNTYVTNKFLDVTMDSTLDMPDELNQTVDNSTHLRLYCKCKSKCVRPRKPGSDKGCPCKASNLKCVEGKCSCSSAGKIICKNREGENVQPVENANNNVVTNQDTNQRPIRDILTELPIDRLIEVTAKLFENDRNRLEDALNEFEHEANVDPPEIVTPSPTIPSFCICNKCLQMPKQVENKCCRQRFCRSKTQVFKNIFLDKENICTAIRNLSDTFVFTPMYQNKSMRHAAYRQYIMWQHGHVGAKKRIVIPSCCVWAIRKAYPSINNEYTGFISAHHVNIV